MFRGMTNLELRALRRQLRMTQREVAEALDVTVNTVARWEQGVHGVSRLAARALSLLAKEHGATTTRKAKRA